MQVINCPLMSNLGPSSRNKKKLNKQKPSRKRKLFLYFYAFANRILYTHEKSLKCKGNKYVQVRNSPSMSNLWPSSRNRTKIQ